MSTSSPIQNSYVSFLTAIKGKLSECIQSEYIQLVSKLYHSTSKQLVRLLKIMPISSNILSLQTLLTQCFQILSIIVQSSQFYKYGHVYPAFKHILKRYQNYNKENHSIINQPKLFKIIQKNNKLSLKKKLMQIQPNQINFLQSNKLTQFFKDLTGREIILQNPQCVCCSQVFIKGFKIENENPIFPLFMQITKEQSMNRAQLLKNLCALSNYGGGVIIIGSQRKNDILYASGIKFKNQQEIIDLQKEIRLIASQIKTHSIYKIERIILHTNFTDQKHINDQQKNVCIRIIIIPKECSRLSYIQFKNKGFHNLYEVYQFDSDLKPIKIDNLVTNQYYSGIYQMIHKKYFTVHGKNSHKNINCILPHHDFSKIYKHHCTENKIKAQQQYINAVQQAGQALVQENHKDQLKFKYKYTSIIVAGASKSKRLMQMLTDYLYGSKQPFEVQKCFPDCFEGSARAVWMLSHTKSFAQIKYMLGVFASHISQKAGAILIMAVQKYLHIQKTKLSQKHLTYIQKKFHLRYNQQIPMEDVEICDKKNNDKRKMVEFTFNNYNQAIFTYMIFEQLQLRPFFIKTPIHQKCKAHY